MNSKKILIGALGLGVLASVLVFLLYKDISHKQADGKNYPLMLAKLDDKNVDFAVWGKNFPTHLEMFESTQDMNQTTDFGGSNPYSKLIRYPQLTTLWAGYPFSVDFNEERGHYYSQIDQMETKRNAKSI